MKIKRLRDEKKNSMRTEKGTFKGIPASKRSTHANQPNIVCKIRFIPAIRITELYISIILAR